MPLKEKEVGSSHVKGGRDVSFTQTRQKTKPRNFPKVTLELHAEARRATYVHVLDFIASGAIIKASNFARFTEGNGFWSYLKYGEQRVNGSRANRKAIKSPQLTTEHS